MQRFNLDGRKKTWCRKIFSLLFISLLLFLSVEASQKDADFQLKGIIRGEVVDEEVNSPIQGALINIKTNSLSVLTDENGEFIITGLPVGIYTVEVSCSHYAPRTVTDIIVKSNRITFVSIKMNLDIDMNEHTEITVSAGYFEDIQKVPASLIIRGGSPAETGFIVNNIEIPNINHYPSYGLSSGALGLLNVDFIQDVKFYSGSFPVIYGDRLSAIMDVTLREGNRDELDFQLDISMVGLGAIAEGPVAQGKGAWLFSARKSYIDLLSGVFDVGVPPKWCDFQGKLDLDLSSRHKLSILGILGNDKSGWG